MAPAIGRHHAEWLSLVETSGPFLSVPVLSKALPQGLDAPDSDITARLRSAREQLDDDPSLHRSWCDFVLREVLDLDEALATGAQIPAGQEHRVAEHSDTVRPDAVVIHRGEGSPKPAMHITIHGSAQRLDRRIADARWSASPIDRIAALCRATGVSLGLASNGHSWALVSARPGETTGVCTWDADLWLEEPITLRAFRTLLGAHRFFSVAEDETLPVLLEQSAKNQQEVTDRLGAQVRQAVELLIDALDRADHDRKGELLGDIANEELYRAAVTMMMRLVFLFVAEERRLLPVDDPLYAESYAASTLREQLEERATRFGEDPLERSSAAWYRLLALSRAVHGGIDHEALRLPAYGGGLFDPDRYQFLEGRRDGTDWQNDAAAPLPVDDRTVLHLLTALQVLTEPGRAGQPPTSVRLSFRALDVEQIGHVYEGLLDHTAVRTFDAALGLVGKPEAEVSLTLLEQARAQGEEALVELLKEHTAKTPAAIRKALTEPADAERAARLLAACDNDPDLRDRVLPFLELVRDDLRNNPRVFLAGALYVTAAGERRASGTYYTPRSLAEEVVQHALDAVAYNPGPAEVTDPAAWRLRSSDELLDLKIADIAMGSGAFLVAACRYLAARLLEAWEMEHSADAVEIPGNEVPSREERPADPLEREVLALRLVAERCIYGVDKNPMAVEMAKLSLWLVTLAKDRPFTFVDHSLREGDSLLGVTSLDQVNALHIDPVRGRELHENLMGYTRAVGPAVDAALELRDELESFVVRDVRDADRKAILYRHATSALNDVRLLADVVVGAALSTAGGASLDAALDSIAIHVPLLLNPDTAEPVQTLARQALVNASQRWLQTGRVDVETPRRCFHWPLELPEVWQRGGFDAVIGNPPFLGGKRISTELGTVYGSYLTRLAGRAGAADLSGHFLRRARTLAGAAGGIGLITTDRISQGETRKLSLGYLLDSGWVLTRVEASREWPGAAATRIALIHARPDWHTDAVLEGTCVARISSSLRPESTELDPAELTQAVLVSTGTSVYGEGFVLALEDAEALATTASEREAIKPYLIASDLTGTPTQEPRRRIIDLSTCDSYADAARYPNLLRHLEATVKPARDALTGQIHQDLFWKFWDLRPELYRALSSLDRVIVCPRVSRFISFARVPSTYVFGDRVVVFANDDEGTLALLQSGIHELWIDRFKTTMGSAPTYVVKTCFRTFPFPEKELAGLAEAEKAYETCRAEVMLDRGIGLTACYGLLHDPSVKTADITDFRDRQVQMDRAVASLYEWGDLELELDFRETGQGMRFTFDSVVRQEILDRLLDLNLKRRSAEEAAGLHTKKKARKLAVSSSGEQTTMFADD